MKPFEDGVKYYTKAYAVVEINFPEDDICCARCRMYNNSTDRCLLDQNIRPARPKNHVGQNCPLMLKEKEDETI